MVLNIERRDRFKGRGRIRALGCLVSVWCTEYFLQCRVTSVWHRLQHAQVTPGAHPPSTLRPNFLTSPHLFLRQKPLLTHQPTLSQQPFLHIIYPSKEYIICAFHHSYIGNHNLLSQEIPQANPPSVDPNTQSCVRLTNPDQLTKYNEVCVLAICISLPFKCP